MECKNEFENRPDFYDPSLQSRPKGEINFNKQLGREEQKNLIFMNLNANDNRFNYLPSDRTSRKIPNSIIFHKTISRKDYMIMKNMTLIDYDLNNSALKKSSSNGSNFYLYNSN